MRKQKESKYRVIRDIRKHFEQEDDYYYKLERLSKFWNNNYIEYESNGDRTKNLLLEEDLHKIRPYGRDMKIGLQESDTWKIQLTMSNVDEDSVMHTKSENKEI